MVESHDDVLMYVSVKRTEFLWEPTELGKPIRGLPLSPEETAVVVCMRQK